jgi:hypothetical protein
VSASSTVGTCSYDGGLKKVTCNLGDMAPGAWATITINVTFPTGTEQGLPHPDPDHPTGTYVGNSASVTWTSTPPGSKSSPVRYTYVGLPDTDGDGCHDYQELARAQHLPQPLGDPDNPNEVDFYDVPTPPIHNAGPAAVKDHVITGLDLSALLFYGGVREVPGDPNANGARYNDDRNNNDIADGREYDYRSAGGWAPDGLVLGLDMSKLLQQGGLSCVAPS